MHAYFEDDPDTDALCAAAEPDAVIERWTLDELDRYTDLDSLRAACADANEDGA